MGVENPTTEHTRTKLTSRQSSLAEVSSTRSGSHKRSMGRRASTNSTPSSAGKYAAGVVSMDGSARPPRKVPWCSYR
jgi:hypothetical protein